MSKKSTTPELDQQKRERPKVVSVSIPPKKQAEFYNALAALKRHHEDPFIQQAPLIVETIIEAARRSGRHRDANIPESIRDGLAQPAELEPFVGQVRSFGIGGMKVGSMTTGTSRLEAALSALRLLGGEHPARSRAFTRLLSMRERESANCNRTSQRRKSRHFGCPH